MSGAVGNLINYWISFYIKSNIFCNEDHWNHLTLQSNQCERLGIRQTSRNWESQKHIGPFDKPKPAIHFGNWVRTYKNKKKTLRKLWKSQKLAEICENPRKDLEIWNTQNQQGLRRSPNITWLPGFVHSIMGVDRVCPTLLGSWWLIQRELSPPLLADVIIPSLHLPGKLGDRCGLVHGGPVQLADVVAVFGRVVLQGSSFAAFLTPELHDGEDSSEFTDHPVLKPEQPEDSQHLLPHTQCCVSHKHSYCNSLLDSPQWQREPCLYIRDKLLFLIPPDS